MLYGDAGTRKGEVRCAVEAQRLAVSLSWAGRVLDGPLTRRVKPSEATWVLEQDQAPGATTTTTLHVMLPKAERHYWRALFEGGEEKSHIEVRALLTGLALQRGRALRHGAWRPRHSTPPR